MGFVGDRPGVVTRTPGLSARARGPKIVVTLDMGQHVKT